MAGVKRKEYPQTGGRARETTKKVKTESRKKVRPITPPSDLEAQTDSDPIVESDTTEHSGDDDGVSWPSDDEETVIPVIKTGIKNVDDGTKTSNHSKGIEKVAGPGGRSNGPHNPTASKEAHAKQKALAQERKAAKPNADSIARAKQLWEKLRIQSKVPLEERKQLIAELFDIITGRVKDFVLKHDSGRVIQTALKYGNLDQRKMIAKELKGEYRGLAESRYAKFMIGKLLVHGDDEIRDLVIPEFYGHVRRMIKHPEAAWILDDVYRGAATPKQKAILLREWYGAEFAIFRSEKDYKPQSDLKLLLTENPEKRAPILRSLFELINQLVQKKTIAFSMLHDAMLQYYLNVVPGSEEATEFVELLKGDEEGDLLKNLAFTKSGSRLVSLALAYSSAKDRKLLLKTYKNTIETLAFDAHGHQVLLAAYDVIDDTVLTAKSIFSEFPTKESKQSESEQHADLFTYVTSLNARIPILYLFVSKPSSILPADDISLLKEIHGIRSTTSKKDPDIRRKELVKALSPSLLSYIAKNAEALLQNSFGCQFVSEVLLNAEGDKSEALGAITSLTESNGETPDYLQSPAASRMLKSLALGGRFNPKTKAIDLADPPLKFNDMLYNKLGSYIVAWMRGPNAFVIVGLLESVDFSHKDELKALIKKHRNELQNAVEETEGLVKDVKDKEGKMMEAGKKGTRLLLKMIEA
ncbi:pumilio domain member 6 [Xylographa opegraphella]|nr:pumilio domain member 6 [Xylographa opegraphella]